jgi:hypothetical protein
MLSKNICFSAVALSFMSSAYPQGATPQAPQMPASPPQQVVAPIGNSTSQNAVLSDEAIRSNPDPAVQRFNREFGGNSNSFAAPSMKMDINGTGISLPKCTTEAKEGKGCD